MPVNGAVSCRHLPEEWYAWRKGGGQYELGQMHRYEQAAYLCEHRKCDEHFWIEKEEASIIGFPSGADSIKVIEKPEIIIRGA
jgi:hypothetical protein